MTTYEQDLDFLRMVCSGATQELSGFLDAKFLDRPALPEEPRYVQGFNHGKEKLQRERVMGTVRKP